MRRISDRVRVIHLSSGHYADDTRIFWKECLSLARAGYDVTFVVPGDRYFWNKGLNIVREGVNVVAVRRYAGRIGRIVVTTTVVFVAGLQQKGDIYHFHDPELLPFGLLLRALGKKVIYDAHEDLPRDILIRSWIPQQLRQPISFLANAVERIAGASLSGVAAATPVIARRFPKNRVALVQNFARKSEFMVDEPVPFQERRAVAYVGGITADRCAVEMVDAMARVDRFPNISLTLGGLADPPGLVEELRALPGWSRVDYRGYQDRVGVRRMLAEARVGLVLFRPEQSFMESQPVKLFEYMAAGIPVIAADFPRFREIVEGNRCGLCVPPCDVSGIASAIEWIWEHSMEAEEMGRRGRELVMSSLNWEHEERTLLQLYQRIIDAG